MIQVFVVKEFFLMRNLFSGFFSVNQIVVITLEHLDLSLNSSILVLTFDIVIVKFDTLFRIV